MQKEFIDFMDRFDGGGRGQTGDKFEGGGLLSLLANAFATPFGSESADAARRLQQSRGVMDVAQAQQAPPPAKPIMRTGGQFAPSLEDSMPAMAPRQAQFAPSLEDSMPAMAPRQAQFAPSLEDSMPAMAPMVGAAQMSSNLGPAMMQAMKDPNFIEFLKVARGGKYGQHFKGLTDEYLAQNYLDHLGGM